MLLLTWFVLISEGGTSDPRGGLAIDGLAREGRAEQHAPNVRLRLGEHDAEGVTRVRVAAQVRTLVDRGLVHSKADFCGGHAGAVVLAAHVEVDVDAPAPIDCECDEARVGVVRVEIL